MLSYIADLMSPGWLYFSPEMCLDNELNVAYQWGGQLFQPRDVRRAEIYTSTVMFTLTRPAEFELIQTDMQCGDLLGFGHVCSDRLFARCLVTQLTNTNKADRSAKRTLRTRLSKHLIFFFLQRGIKHRVNYFWWRRQNAQWTLSRFLFGLSFKWKFATQWCAELHQNGILDWISPCVVDG